MKMNLPMLNPSSFLKNPMRLRNKSGKKIARYAVPAVATGALAGAAAYMFTKDKETASVTAGIGAVLGLALAAYSHMK